MVVTRKEKETNQQVLRRFNRTLQMMRTLQTARDKQEFKKAPTRFIIKTSAVRRDKLRANRQWY